MRILIVNSGLRYGGAEKQIVELSQALAGRGHAVAIYTLTNDVPRLAELQGTGVEVVIDNKKSRLDLAVLLRLRRFVKRFAADVVHGFLYDGNIYARVAAAGLGVPVLNSERSDNYALRPAQVWPHRLTRRLAAGVVANTYTGRDFAQRLFGLPDDRLHVVTNGVPLDALAACAAQGGERYRNIFFGGADVRVALLVGAISAAKDYLLALDVADALTRQDPRWRVLFVGDSYQGTFLYAVDEAQDSGHYRDAVHARYDALALRGRAVFAGQRTDVPRIMAQCDVLFSTSRNEGFPNVVLEAMSVGLPVVSVEYSDIRRILPFDWQVTPRRPAAMVAAMERALQEREQVAARQLAWVRAHATIEHAARAMENVYRGYVGTRAERAVCL